MKPRIQPYISPENFHWLKAMAKRPGLSESTIIDGAVTAYRAGESDNKREAAINRRLDRLTRQFGRIERDNLVLAETLATFVHYFLTVTPPVPANQVEAARAKGDRDGISDDEVLGMLQSMIKQRRESIALYEKGGRMELAQQEAEEIAVIEEFLPEQMSHDEMAIVITRIIGEVGAESLKDMGKAMGALKEVALDVWDRIKRGAALVGESFEGAALAIKAAFLGAFASILEGFAGFTGTIASGWNTLLGSMGIEVNAQGLGAGLAASLRSQADSAFDSANVYNASLSASWSDLTVPLESVGKLRDLVKGTKDETEGAADAADRLNTALDELDGKGGGGAGKVKDASDKLKDSFDSVRAAAKSAFSGVVTGAKTAKEALRDVLNSFLQLAANRLFESMLGPIFDKIKIPGFAMGTNFAPGGLAVVGEAGPELVNLPRGSQVVPNHRMAEALTGGNSRVELMIHAPDSVTVRQVGEISRAVSVEVSTRMAREQAAGLQGGIDSLSARGVS